MYKVVFFAPFSCKEKVKMAMFQAGAGRMGAYDCCSFEVLGKGQFRPLEGSSPFIGQQNQLESVDEYRVEMICPDHLLQAVVQALIEAHDYEVPAYDIIQLAEVGL